MTQILDSVKEEYKNLENEEKIIFLERINQRKKGDFNCDVCPRNNSPLVSLCNLCNLVYYNFSSNQIEKEINLLK